MKLLHKTLAILAVTMSLSPYSWAKVAIAPDFKGTLIVTLENGDVSLYESGDPIPEIPQNATIEVFDGSISIQTEADDQIQVGCFGDEQAVGGGSSAELTCGASSGLLKVDGKEYPISGAQAQVAEPTADSDSTGVPADQDAAPDSRSIQASTVS
jgi:hypothetical protein